MMGFFRKKNKERKGFFLENGRLLLEELISSSGGKNNPVRTFTADQIIKATNNFDWSLVVSVDRFVWYKGMIDGRLVLIRRCVYKDYGPDNIHRDIAVSSLTSSHKNVLKLLGCCLELPVPVLVCEYVEKGTLTGIARAGDDHAPLPWSTRLKIAKEIASAVAYLHTTFSQTIVHRDIKLRNIFLDENWTAKLSSFSLCIWIPQGESGVHDRVCGTSSYIEPDYCRTGFVTENVDVYSFGIILLVFLTGKFQVTWDGHPVPLPDYVRKLVEKGQFTEMIDPSMVTDWTRASASEKHQRLQMEAFLELALRCIRFRLGEVAPKMMEVAKVLKQIERCTNSSLPS